MPGRIKPHHTAHNRPHNLERLKLRPHLTLLRREDTPLDQDDAAVAGSLFETTAPDAKGFILNKQTIIWLVVISVIVLATLITVTCLLCKCKRRRKGDAGVKRHPNGHRWHPSLEVKDGRNDFQAWNRHAPPRPSLSEQGGIRMATWESGASITPLRPAAAASSANGSAMMEPIVVDYAQEGVSGAKKNSRYYSRLSSGRTSIWKRISQIGRAY